MDSVEQGTDGLTHDTGQPNRGPIGRLRESLRYIPDGSTIPDPVWRARHRGVIVATLLQLPLWFLLGVYSGTTPIAEAQIPATPLPLILLEIGIVFAFSATAAIPQLPRRLRTALAATGLLASSVVLVQFSGGYIEAHFHFFVGMGVLAVYEDWAPFVLGLTYVVFTHGVFGMIEPSRVYNHTAAINNPWIWGLIHGVFVLGLAAALTSSWVSTERSRERSQQRLEQARQRATQIEDLEAKQQEIQAQREEAEAAKAEAEEKMAEVQSRNETLQAMVEDYREAMQKAAAGDLSVRIEADGDNEALAEIGRAFNGMMDDLEETVGEVKQFADDVTRRSEEASTTVEEAQHASESVSESVQEIADAATEQREKLETTADEMTQLSASVEEVAASAETVAERSSDMARIADAGEDTAERAINTVEDVQEAIKATADRVDALDQQMTEIGEIVGLISEVAEQTNMLALNANIEAARAGDDTQDGTGFAVVANEVKQLAEETRDAAGDIEELIEETRGQSRATVEEVERAQDNMDAALDAIGDTVDAFSQVATNADETDNGVQEISDATDDQAASTEEAVSMIDDIAEISQETASETESVSAAAEQQAASMSEVDATVSTLADRAADLQSLLAEFSTATGNPDPDMPQGNPTTPPVSGDGGQSR